MIRNPGPCVSAALTCEVLWSSDLPFNCHIPFPVSPGWDSGAVVHGAEAPGRELTSEARWSPYPEEMMQGSCDPGEEVEWDASWLSSTNNGKIVASTQTVYSGVRHYLITCYVLGFSITYPEYDTLAYWTSRSLRKTPEIRSLWHPPPSFLKQVIKLFPSLYQEERDIFISEEKENEKNSNKQGWLQFPTIPHTL